MENVKPKILVIDDEKEMLSTCRKMLTAFGFESIELSDSEFVIQVIKNESFDVILTDLLMPNLDGMEILKTVKEYASNTPVIIFTAYGTIDRAVSFMKAGAFDFIEKPFEADHLKVIIDKALNYRHLHKERNNLLKQLENKYKFENIIGKSSCMLKIFEMVESIAETDSNVLITGESGTGKELIARSIHARSKRKTKPFVPVNCGSLPENLFEAEIFGYEKGAFTSASQKKPGLLEYANEGSFSLDEVCELPYNLQSKLLRVLQDNQLRRLGSNELTQVDIRLISATNRDIEEYLRNGQLRDDLYYRLNVINIHIPPLRERKEDIRLLADYFLKKISAEGTNKVIDLSEEVSHNLESYHWPGNVRELENVIERAITFAKGDKIGLHDLPQHIQKLTKTNHSFGEMSLKEIKNKALADVEKNYLTFLLEKHKGNITKAAQEAEMTRRNIYSLLRKYHINPDLWR